MLPISVIVPCYRCASTVQRAINSAIAQSRKPVEIILICDGVSDSSDTLAMLRQITSQPVSGDIHMRLIQFTHNKGPSAARNAGWEMATQPYIAFLDADDVWHPEKLEKQFEWMLQNPNVAMCGHGCRFIYDDDDATRFALQHNGTQVASNIVTRNSILRSNPFVTSSIMLQRALPLRFDETLRYCEDYWLLMQLCFANYTIAYLSATWVNVAWDESRSTAGKKLWHMRMGEIGCYWRLHKQGHISHLRASLLTTYSFGKFSIRLVIGHRGIWRLRNYSSAIFNKSRPNAISYLQE